MTLQQLHYVLVIAEAGSLNRAAEQLYLSQPSLTSAVRELEKELGIVLFNRSGRGVTPTQDGAEFLLYARQLYHQYESLIQRRKKHQAQVRRVHAALFLRRQGVCGAGEAV